MAGTSTSAGRIFLILKFAMQIFIAIIMLAGANVMIATMANQSVPRQLIHRIDINPDATLLASGNSLVAAAFNEDEFQTAWNAAMPSARANIKPLNIALGASGTVEELLLLRHTYAVNQVANVVVFGFYNQMLTERPTGGWDDLTGNRAMSYYVEPYFAAQLYAPQSRWEPIQLAVIGHMPMLVERLTLWAKVENMRRNLEEIGLPRVQTTQFGRVNDFQRREVSNDEEFLKTCQQSADQKVPFAPSIELMIEATQKRHGTFVIVEMPMNSEHRNRCYNQSQWHAYEQHLIALSREKQTVFINASEWLPDQYFADSLHAGPEGAIDFSDRLAKELKSLLLVKWALARDNKRGFQSRISE